MIEQMVPPGSNADHVTGSHFPAPVDFDRSFLMRQRTGIHDCDPPLVTPIDEFSGLPWVILPPEYPLPAGWSDIADDNHAFHPARSPLLATIAGNALRNSRVQRVDWYDHHIVYHGYFAGPELPHDEADIFRRIVFAVAKYIPDMAIDCHGYEPTAVPITDAQKERLWRTNELRIGRRGVVREFLGNYVVQQDLSHVKDSTIDEFLSTEDQSRRQFLGQWLLAQASEVATDPIDQRYRWAVKEGKVPPYLTRKSPNLVKNTLGNQFQTGHYVRLLHERLAA